MKALPQTVVEYLVAIATQDHSLAYLQTTLAGRLISGGGDLHAYGLTALAVGDDVSDRLLFLAGLFPFVQPVEILPAVHGAQEQIIDVHLLSGQTDSWILLLDATANSQQQQQLQQKGNDLRLLRQQHDRLLSQLSQAAPASVEISQISQQILAALQILSLERKRGGLAVIGQLPDWAKSKFPADHTPSALFSAETFSPFLENFMIDADDFWQARHPSQLLRSGVWNEADAAGNELYLEAIALYIEGPSKGQQIILVESSLADSDRFRWLQTARQDQLSFVSEQKLAANAIVNATFYDALTGLPNRSLFLSRLETFFANSQGAAQRGFAVVVLNLDRFRILNSSLGNATGDRVLTLVARRIQASLRQHDVLGRLGADEFGILLSSIRQVQAAAVIIERLLDSISQPVCVNGQKLYFTASAGIAPSEDWYKNAQDLLRDAELAMYQAKALGRSGYCSFDREMRGRAFELWSLESSLQTAIEQKEFQLWYQPIVNLQTHQVEAFEALIRWHHPVRGWISPAQFIPLAEESGQIVAIDTWVVNTACQSMRQWQLATGKTARVNINISPQHFSEDDLFEKVRQAIATAQITPSALGIELTERFLLADAQVAITTLNQLKALGIKISIDDFGTGYASLSYLQDLPLDNLKIDGYFIEMMASSGPDIVHTIIELAHKLGFGVTAERVETMEQSQMLRQLGCDMAQGYLFSHAVPALSAQGLIDVEVIASEWAHCLPDPPPES